MTGEEPTPARQPFAAAAAEDPMRHRLVTAGLWALARHGYVDCTVAQIVARARTSRRTFYAYFGDREDCLLAGYELATEQLMADMDVARQKERRWPERVLTGLDVYLTGVLESPEVARAFLVEIRRFGPAADARRQAVVRRWARWVSENSRLDLDLPGPDGVPRRAMSETEALGALAAVLDVLGDAVLAGPPPDEAALRRECGRIMLTFATSPVPPDLGPWLEAGQPG